MSAPPAASPPRPSTPPDRQQLRQQYDALGQDLKRWVLVGAALLLAWLLLWWRLPTGQPAAPIATRGYRWLQAGTVQDSGTTWLWALADSAGQARLLLSRTRGRTWLARRLGVPTSQAHALALNWGRPWRGVLLGSKGELRVLPDALHLPLQGTALKPPAAVATALAVDTQGRQLVLGDSVRGIWQSADAGNSWQPARPDSKLAATLPAARHVLFDPVENRFFAITATYRPSEPPQMQQMQMQQMPRVTQLADCYLWKQAVGKGESGTWTRTHPTAFRAATARALYTGLAANGSLLIIYQDGSATQLSRQFQTTDPVEGRYRLFSGLAQAPLALALVGGPGEPLTDNTATGKAALLLASDSVLLFEAAAEGGRIRRWRLGTEALPAPQPAALDTSAFAVSTATTGPAPTPVAQGGQTNYQSPRRSHAHRFFFSWQ